MECVETPGGGENGLLWRFRVLIYSFIFSHGQRGRTARAV